MPAKAVRRKILPGRLARSDAHMELLLILTILQPCRSSRLLCNIDAGNNCADVLVHPVPVLPITRSHAGPSLHDGHRYVVSHARHAFPGCLLLLVPLLRDVLCGLLSA